MTDINKILSRYALKSSRYTIKGKTHIVDTDQGRLVLKKKQNDLEDELYNYLKTRSFEYFPPKVDEVDEYNIYEYVEGVNIPSEQKATDIIHLLTLLHSKTTYYKEIDVDDYKELYEDTTSRINYLLNYYQDLITIIDSKVYMSPSEYLLARNISKVLACLWFCKNEIEHWYSLVSDKHKKRVVTLHNNLSLDHYIKKDQPYFISWQNSKVDTPILDLYIFYQRHALDLDFISLFNQYESKYPLFEDEKSLLFVLISIPEKFVFKTQEYDNCARLNNFLEYIFKTEKLLTACYQKDEPVLTT